MFNNGIIRSLISNIPESSWNAGSVASSDVFRIVEQIPQERCNYIADKMDFSPYFTIKRGRCCILDWTKVEIEARPYVKDFSLDNLDQGLKISTESNKIPYLSKILSIAITHNYSHSFFNIDEEDIIYAIETRWSGHYSLQLNAYNIIISFVRFLKEKKNVLCFVSIERLEEQRIYISDNLRGYRQRESYPRITDNHLNAIIDGLSHTMHNKNIPLNDRITAGIILLNTQLGLRTSEIPALKKDCLHSVENTDGKIDYYITYLSIKAARQRQEGRIIKTICTQIAKETIEYLLLLRQQIPGLDKNPFLYVQDDNLCRAGLVIDKNVLRDKYKLIMTKYLFDVSNKEWPNIEKISIKKIVKGNAIQNETVESLSIPAIHSYRVTFASKLYDMGISSEYINAIMSHSPQSNCNDSYIPDAKPPKNSTNEIDRIFTNL